MSWWQRLLAALRGDSGFMVREGHELRWDRGALPLTVYVGPSAQPWMEHVQAAVAHYNQAAGRRVMFSPLAPIEELSRLWHDDMRRLGLRGCIYVQGGNVSSLHGDSDIQFDKRTGALRNVLVTMPFVPPAWAHEMALHELGHCLGLDHDADPSSIMAPVVRVGAGQVLLDSDVKRLAEAYGA